MSGFAAYQKEAYSQSQTHPSHWRLRHKIYILLLRIKTVPQKGITDPELEGDRRTLKGEPLLDWLGKGHCTLWTSRICSKPLAFENTIFKSGEEIVVR
jgi:hypothetical protein